MMVIMLIIWYKVNKVVMENSLSHSLARCKVIQINLQSRYLLGLLCYTNYAKLSQQYNG